MSSRVVLNKRVVYAVSALLLVAAIALFYNGFVFLNEYTRFVEFAEDSPVPEFAWRHYLDLRKMGFFNLGAGLMLVALAVFSLAYQKLRG